jgi:hypothetical protein
MKSDNACVQSKMLQMIVSRRAIRHDVSRSVRIALKMEAMCPFETLATSYQTTPCHNPEDHNMRRRVYYSCV